MRKIGDENLKISSVNFRIEIDTDDDEEEEEEDDDEDDGASPGSPGKRRSSPIDRSFSANNVKRSEAESSIIGKNRPLLPIDGNRSRVSDKDGSSLIAERRSDSPPDRNNRTDRFLKIDDPDRSPSTIEELPESTDPVIIKLSSLDMSAAECLTAYPAKRVDELSISKFIFTSADRSVGKSSKNFLEVPQRYDDRRRVYDVSSSRSDKPPGPNEPVANGSASSPDFLTDPRCARLNAGLADESALHGRSAGSAIVDSPERKIVTGRRPSITNAAIGSSIAASLVGASSGVSESLVRSATPSSVSISSTVPSDEVAQEDGPPRFRDGRRRSKLPFLRLHMPQPHSWSNVTAASDLDDNDRANNRHNNYNNRHHHHSLGTHFPHIHVPSFTFAGDGTSRKFNFGIRRHSQMVSPLSKKKIHAIQNQNNLMQINNRGKRQTTRSCCSSCTDGAVHLFFAQKPVFFSLSRW